MFSLHAVHSKTIPVSKVRIMSSLLLPEVLQLLQRKHPPFPFCQLKENKKTLSQTSNNSTYISDNLDEKNKQIE